jgi:hypothetical protein
MFSPQFLRSLTGPLRCFLFLYSVMCALETGKRLPYSSSSPWELRKSHSDICPLIMLTVLCRGSIASIVRFRYIPALVESSNNFFGHILGLAIWSCVELGLGVIAGSLATLRPLVRQFLRFSPLSRYGGSRSGSSFPSNHSRFNRKKQFNTDTTLQSAYSEASDSGRNRGVRKSRIGFPLTYGTETVITVGTGRTPMMLSSDDHDSWDIEAAAMLDAPEKYEQETFGVLNPLPAIPPRSHKRDLTRNVELKTLGPGTGTRMDRRYSAPG